MITAAKSIRTPVKKKGATDFKVSLPTTKLRPKKQYIPMARTTKKNLNKIFFVLSGVCSIVIIITLKKLNYKVHLKMIKAKWFFLEFFRPFLQIKVYKVSMKRIFKISFVCFLFVAAIVGIQQYYQSLPIRGAYETRPVNYPQVDSESLKTQLSKCSIEELQSMKQAGLEAIKWQTLLSKVDSTVIADVVKDFSQFYIGDRYPHDESYDEETQSSYFYHSHRSHEHGHFHIYFSNEEVLKQFKPIAQWDSTNKSTTHLVAISMHPNGDPIEIFLPNHWVTKDEWFKAEEMMTMVDLFEIKHPYPSWPSNQWVNQMFKLFRPQIEQAFLERDRLIQESEQPLEQLIKNKKREILTSVSISIPAQMQAIEELLQEKSTTPINSQVDYNSK